MGVQSFCARNFDLGGELCGEEDIDVALTALANILRDLDDHVAAVELRERRGRLVPRAARPVAPVDLKAFRLGANQDSAVDQNKAVKKYNCSYILSENVLEIK